MDNNEYRERESGFSGQPESGGPSGGDNRTNTQYPYGQDTDHTQYPYGQSPDNTQYPYGQQPGNTQYPYGQTPDNTQYPYGQNPRNTQYPYGQTPGNTQYPYGQTGRPYPYGGSTGGQNPYGGQPGGRYPYGGSSGGQYPYGGQPYGYYPPRKTFGEKLREAFADPSRRNLMLLGMAAGTGVLLYLLLSTVFSAIITSSDSVYDRYLNDDIFSLLAEAAYSMVCVALPFALVFAVVRRVTKVSAPIPFGKPRGGWQAVLLLPAGLGLCFIGNLISTYIVSFANSFGVTFRSYEYALEQQTDAPESLGVVLLTVVHTAVLPALLEELVFRGFILQPLRKYGDWFAVITSALIFGLVHANVTQVPFAILAGLALGYINVVTGSMWMNILLHFLNNLISVLYSFAIASSGEGVGIVLSIAVTYGVILLGIAAFVGYAFSNRNFARLRPGDQPRFPHKAAYYWLMPTVVIALLLIAQRIAADVVIR